MIEPPKVLAVLRDALLGPEWHPRSHTIEQMVRFAAGWDEQTADAVLAILPRRPGLSVSEMNAKGSPTAVRAVLLDAMIATARCYPMKPGDLNPLTNERTK